MATENEQETQEQEEAPVKKRYSKKLKEVEFEVEDEQGGLVQYIIRELMGDDRNAHLNLVAKHLRHVGGTTVPRDYRQIQEDLIHRSVRIKDGDKVIPTAIIQKWPASMFDDVYKDCLSLSGLDKKAEDAEKND